MLKSFNLFIICILLNVIYVSTQSIEGMYPYELCNIVSSHHFIEFGTEMQFWDFSKQKYSTSISFYKKLGLRFAYKLECQRI